MAMDLPIEDRGATFHDYADSIAAALGDADDVVLVGHSMAGISIPLVALRRPVRMLVFLCALFPDRAGDTSETGPKSSPDHAFDALVRFEDGSHAWPAAEAARRTLYSDCSLSLASWAFAHLRRQQTALWDRWAPMPAWPDVAVASIHCRDDRAVSPDWCRWIARNRLGIESVELPGGHSPMLSRPAALAGALVAAAGASPGAQTPG